MEPRIPGRTGGSPRSANDLVRAIADAAEAKGLEVAEIVEGSPHTVVLRRDENGRNRHTGRVRIEIEGYDLLANIAALPSFREEQA